MTLTFSQALGLFFLLVAVVELIHYVVRHRRRVAYSRSRANHPAGRALR